MDFKKRLFFVLGVTLLFLLVFGGGLFYLRSSIGTLSETLAQAQSDLAFQLNARQSSALLQQQFEEAQAFESSLDAITPSKDELVGLSRSFQLLKADYGVEGDFTFGQERGGSDGTLLEIRFTVSGLPDNVLQFMQALADLPYFIKMESIDVTREGIRWQVSARGAAFFFAE